MPIVTTCIYCGLGSVGDSVCSVCKDQIAKGERRGGSVARARGDCPFHPGKKVFCRAFGSTSNFFEAKHPTCRKHWLKIQGKETAELLRHLRELKNRRSKIGPTTGKYASAK